VRIIQFIPLCIIFTCSATPPSLVDLSIKKIIALVNFKDIDKLPLPLPTIEQLKPGSFIKYVTHSDDFAKYINEMHDVIFFKTREAIFYKHKLVNDEYTELPAYPHNDKHSHGCNPLNSKPKLYDHGYFVTYANRDYEEEDSYAGDYADVWDYQSHSIFFALVGRTEKGTPECLFIHRRDNTRSENWRKPITKLEIYPLDTFKNKTWSDYTFGSDIVKEDNYAELHVEPFPPAPEAYSSINSINSIWEERIEVKLLEIRKGIDRAVVLKKKQQLDEKERAIDDFYKAAKLDQDKKYFENYHAAEAALENACTMSKLTIYKIIKGLPIPRSHVDEIYYTGTIPLKIQDEEAQYPLSGENSNNACQCSRLLRTY
jgi:hypothetical protein